MLDDDSFTEHYIDTNQTRIAESYAFTAGFLRSHSIPFYPGANAGFFIWCNLGAYLVSKQRTINKKGPDLDALSKTLVSQKVEQTVTQKLLANKVFISSGKDFGGEEPGWFRIVFTHPRSYLEEGLKRMVEACQ
jgi:bifunctional pyridoxal-dependent enzyme with beta-cystathionase and maltose regulon repressor activities